MNTTSVETLQLSLWDSNANWGRKKGSCVPSKRLTHEPTHEHILAWVQVYHVTRRGEKHKYFRFCYLPEPGNIGSCVRVHLPGGNIENPKSNALKQKVESAIALGMSVRAIVQIIKSSTNR